MLHVMISRTLVLFFFEAEVLQSGLGVSFFFWSGEF